VVLGFAAYHWCTAGSIFYGTHVGHAFQVRVQDTPGWIVDIHPFYGFLPDNSGTGSVSRVQWNPFRDHRPGGRNAVTALVILGAYGIRGIAVIFGKYQIEAVLSGGI